VPLLVLLLAFQAWRCVLAMPDTDSDTSDAVHTADDKRGVATLTWDSAGNLGKVVVMSIYVISDMSYEVYCDYFGALHCNGYTVINALSITTA
jgi:hypothetical protein